MSAEGGMDRGNQNHLIKNALDRIAVLEGYKHIVGSYNTGWINRSDGTNVHMGSNTTKNVDSSVAHNLGANLSELIVKVFISTDGTDANSFEFAVNGSYDGSLPLGITVYQVDTNNVKVQTGGNGLQWIEDAGTRNILDTEDWYYKIVVYKIST